jgi:hypothetical protein
MTTLDRSRLINGLPGALLRAKDLTLRGLHLAVQSPSLREVTPHAIEAAWGDFRSRNVVTMT